MRCRVHRAVIACRAPMCLNCVRQVRTEMRVTGRIQQIVGCVQEENIVKVMGWVIQLVIVLQGKNDKISDFVKWIYPTWNNLYMLIKGCCCSVTRFVGSFTDLVRLELTTMPFADVCFYHWATYYSSSFPNLINYFYDLKFSVIFDSSWCQWK